MELKKKQDLNCTKLLRFWEIIQLSVFFVLIFFKFGIF